MCAILYTGLIARFTFYTETRLFFDTAERKKNQMAVVFSSTSSGLFALPESAWNGHSVDNRPCARGRFMPPRPFSREVLACASALNIDPEDVTRADIEENASRARMGTACVGTPAYIRDVAAKGLSRSNTRTLFLRDSNTRMGRVDVRYVSSSQDAPGSMAAAPDPTEEVLSAIQRQSSGRSGSGPTDIYGGRTLRAPKISSTEYVGSQWTHDGNRRQLADLPNLNAQQWWCVMKGGDKERLAKLHAHKYNCRERHCYHHKGPMTCGLASLGQWDCSTRFATTVLNMTTLINETFYFYVDSDCCPPRPEGGWVTHGVTVLTNETYNALPPFIKPQTKTVFSATTRTNATKADGSDGAVQVKTEYLVYRYNRAVVDDITLYSQSCSTVDQLREYAIGRYEIHSVPGTHEFLFRAPQPPARAGRGEWDMDQSD